ncbi:putative WRKY transcription factor 2 [Camellia lanceoleosa]|uniref:WRKY transcription factor 2 n=1 Tax=Camellia lanceoleosa TaxID=1840588 RepID=A0ACC0IY34_9ERIC|nr:putative WRKY transcription factor 2 [Camellia lanceoleosa]
MVSNPKGLVQSFVSEEKPSIMSDVALNVEKIDDPPPLNLVNNHNGGKSVDKKVVASVSDNNVHCSVETAVVRNDGRGSIAERRATTCEFNSPRINTVGLRSTSPPLTSPAARSSYITIPAGISPTALLDSPIMLSNSQAEPSPTTGTFQSPFLNHGSLMLDSTTPDADTDRGSDDDSSFRFQPHGSPVSLTCTSGLETKSCHTGTAGEQMPQYSEPIHGDDEGVHHLPEGDQKGTYPTMEAVKTSEDGYNWRKYGQKQVKGSEYPRSYYKCTNPYCQVKKKVERSHDGQITEIIYKGAHCHPKPQPNRRSALGYSFSYNEKMSEETGEVNGSCVKIGSEWRADGFKRTSSTSALTEISNPLMSTAQGKSLGELFESVGTSELSSMLASHNDDNEDGTTHGSICRGDDADDNELELKRRKKDSSLTETNLASRAGREPRVVVQIESDVDILNDGYRWRKYGQKVVKGNPNPSGHVNSGSGILTPTVSSTLPTLTLPKNDNSPKPEAHAQDQICFARNLDPGNQFLRRPSLLGNFGSDVKFRVSSMYQMKFPFLQNSMPYGSFVLNPTHSGMQAAGSIAPVVPDFPMSLPLTIRQSARVAPGGFSCSNNHGKSFGPVQSCLGGQQLRESMVTWSLLK